MAITYAIDKNRGILLEVWQGTTSRDEWFAYCRKVSIDPDLPTKPKWLADFRAGSLPPEVGEADLAIVADMLLKSDGRARGGLHAIVTAGDFDRPNAFDSMIPGYFAGALSFVNFESACVWLGLDPEETQRWINQVLQGMTPPASSDPSSP